MRRISGDEGYVEKAWDDLNAARQIDTPDVDLAALRQEAILSLGDFRGYSPVRIAAANRRISACACIQTANRWQLVTTMDASSSMIPATGP